MGEREMQEGRKDVIFLDHHFNKQKQDPFAPYLEDSRIIFPVQE